VRNGSCAIIKLGFTDNDSEGGPAQAVAAVVPHWPYPTMSKGGSIVMAEASVLAHSCAVG
jgi:hypothetical protein